MALPRASWDTAMDDGVPDVLLRARSYPNSAKDRHHARLIFTGFGGTCLQLFGIGRAGWINWR
jgi:hypothetical protein